MFRLGPYLGNGRRLPQSSLERGTKRKDNVGSFTILADNTAVWQGVNAEVQGIAADEAAIEKAGNQRGIELSEITLGTDAVDDRVGIKLMIDAVGPIVIVTLIEPFRQIFGSYRASLNEVPITFIDAGCEKLSPW